MSAPGFTPIQLYFSTTASAAPSAGNLANGELAINITDGKLYYKDNGGVVKVLAGTGGTGVVAGSNTQIQFNNNGVFGAAAGLTWDGTTLTANALTVTNAVTLNGGTANGVAYLNGSKVLTTGSALTFDGTGLAVNSPSAIGGGKISAIVDLTAANGLVLRDSATTYANNDNYVLLQNSTNATAGGLTHPAAQSLGVWGFDDIRFLQGSGAAEQMRLTSTGLGIGTSSPAYKLDVSDAAVRARITSSTGTNSAFYQAVNTSGSAYIGLDNSAGSLTGSAGAAYSLNLMHVGAYPIIFSTSGTERMRIDASGNLGLGVTPSAWFSTRRVLQLQTASSIASFIGSEGFEIRSNAFLNTSAQEIYVTSAPATLYGTSGGQHRFYTAPSGTAGNAISFTQAMTLDASGNLLVGVTSYNAAVNSNYFLYGSGLVSVGHVSGTSSGSVFQQFVYNATQIGSITQSGTTGVLYNITSDYRLKNVVGAVSGSGDRIDALQPVEYTMKADGSQHRGFLAHQFQAVYANSVNGTKDAVDENGKPVYQTMQASASEVIADLVAEIQSLRKRLAAAGIA